MHSIGKLNAGEWHIRLAEIFEAEGDYLVKEKKPNTYYPTLSEVYLNGLREINSVADCDILRQRLNHKVAEAQKENYNMVRAVGIPMTPPVNYKEVQDVISRLGIDSFISAYKELISMPIVSESIITEYVNISKSCSSPIIELFSQTVKIDDKGAKVGLASGDDIYINNARSFFRERNIALISSIKNAMDSYIKVDKAFVFGLMEHSKSKFIPEDRIYIYAEGVYEGFNNNFISSSHLLIPQLENSFRYIALQNGVQTTKWQNDLQHKICLVGV